jgi:hypothetical protein
VAFLEGHVGRGALFPFKFLKMRNFLCSSVHIILTQLNPWHPITHPGLFTANNLHGHILVYIMCLFSCRIEERISLIAVQPSCEVQNMSQPHHRNCGCTIPILAHSQLLMAGLIVATHGRLG